MKTNFVRLCRYFNVPVWTYLITLGLALVLPALYMMGMLPEGNIFAMIPVLFPHFLVATRQPAGQGLGSEKGLLSALVNVGTFLAGGLIGMAVKSAAGW